jgi:thioredoxin reductase (NADPH)
MNNLTEKLVILGSGPAGLTAAVYGARANLHPLVIEGSQPGGQLMGTTHVENWPGCISILGPTLMIQLRGHAAHFDTRFLSQEVCEVDLHKHPFTLRTTKGLIIQTHALIIATGATYRKLHCLGEDEYWGKGITTCAVCDGAFYQGKKVIIVGGGDTAMEDASFMTNFTNDITVVHILPHFTASYPMQQRVLQNPAIKIIYESTVTEIRGDGNRVTEVVVTHQKTGEKTIVAADGIFIAIGLRPNTTLFKGQLELDKHGYILLKDTTHTSIAGVFAAGDVADYRYRQAITSAGTGCAASLDAERYIKELNI